MAREKQRVPVCPVTEMAPGQRRLVEVDDKSIGIFRIDDQFYAIRNMCPHQRAPLCRGHISATATSDKPGEWKWEREHSIIRCPWHGWEFDIKTGRSVFNPHRCGVMTFPGARVR